MSRAQIAAPSNHLQRLCGYFRRWFETLCRLHNELIHPWSANGVPELELDKHTYAEYSKLILLPEYRSGNVSQRMYQHLNCKARQQGVRYVFVIANRLHARLYINSYRKLGYHVTMLKNVVIPARVNAQYNGVAECIIMLDMQPDDSTNTQRYSNAHTESSMV